MKCASINGFNLHAQVHVGSHQRQKLEQLVRYMARPPMAVVLELTARKGFNPVTVLSGEEAREFSRSDAIDAREKVRIRGAPEAQGDWQAEHPLPIGSPGEHFVDEDEGQTVRTRPYCKMPQRR